MFPDMPDVPYTRYLFVGGLHRSGTSLTARLAATLPGMGAISGAPVPEQEGVYLQGAIPHTALHGAPGRFADDPAQHLIEGGPYDTLDIARRMRADWAPWFPPGTPWRVEKSPVNLLRMRLYQQLFPLSQFVVVVRDPRVVAMALGKWVDRDPGDLVAYWARAMALVAEDLRYLHAAMVVRYEDLVAAPDAQLRALAAFCDLPVAPDPGPLHDGNTDYAVPPMDLAGEVLRVMARYGYTPDGLAPLPPDMAPRHPLRAVREAACLPIGATLG